MKKIALSFAAAVTAIPFAFAPSFAFAATTYTPSLVKEFDNSDNANFEVDSIIPFSDTQGLVVLGNDDVYLTDGTADGTTEITDLFIAAGLDSWDLWQDPRTSEVATDGAGNLYFIGWINNLADVWWTDGTAVDRVTTENFPRLNTLNLLDGDIYAWGRTDDYTYNGDTLYQVTISDGAVVEIIGGNDCDGPQDDPRQIHFVNGRIVFANDLANNCDYQLLSWDPANPLTAPVDLGDATDASGTNTNFADWEDRIVYNGEVYFPGQTSYGDWELFATDGTVGGTRLVADLNSGGSSNPGDNSYMWFTILDNELYFTADNGSDRLLFKTDGTTLGTGVAVDLNDPSNDIEGPAAVLNGKMYLAFTDFAANIGQELYVSDGTEAGTSLLKDIYTEPGTGSQCWYYCVQPTTFDDHVFFVAYGDTSNNEVWVTDGTSNGTVQVTDFDGEYAVGKVQERTLVQVGDHLLFGVVDAVGDGGTGQMALYSLGPVGSALAKTGVDAAGIALGGALALAAGAAVAIRRRARA